MDLITKLIEAHIFREQDNVLEFLLLKRSKDEYYPNLWQMVSGKIEKDEPAFKTALREIKEETGLVPENLWAAPNVNSFYSVEDNAISFLPVFAAKVKLDSRVELSKEHSEFLWVSPEKAKKLLAWPGQRNSIEIITEYFINESKYLKFVEIML
ncbi:MAG TPA: NUDIX pyrophosphatase [Ignavibacteriaceae bacterium]|nr:NUDIX pyrophosphatase [Ignavibacteriaceae bacterium]